MPEAVEGGSKIPADAVFDNDPILSCFQNAKRSETRTFVPAPSPRTLGEGRREGDLERRQPLVLEITLILTFSQTTGRRDQSGCPVILGIGVGWVYSPTILLFHNQTVGEHPPYNSSPLPTLFSPPRVVRNRLVLRIFERERIVIEFDEFEFPRLAEVLILRPGGVSLSEIGCLARQNQCRRDCVPTD